MGKSTLYQSPRLMVGLNAFEPGQTHALHAHEVPDALGVRGSRTREHRYRGKCQCRMHQDALYAFHEISLSV